jgi:hypothetical protein
MFDNIKCEVTLPITKKIAKIFGDKDWTQVPFQTKDLDCLLSTYIIKKNKSLIHRYTKREWVPSKKEKGVRGFLNGLRKDRWHSPYQVVNNGTVSKKQKHTGLINFYAIEKDIEGNEWDIEFDAKFVDGLMVSIKLKKVEMWRTFEDVVKNDKEITEMMKNSYNHFPNKVRRFLNKVTFGYWRWFWFKVSRAITFIPNKISLAIVRYL